MKVNKMRKNGLENARDGDLLQRQAAVRDLEGHGVLLQKPVSTINKCATFLVCLYSSKRV